MGWKNGTHIISVERLDFGGFYIIEWKANKCKYAKVYKSWASGVDELDAALKFKRKRETSPEWQIPKGGKKWST